MISFQTGDHPEFESWPKIARLNREVIATEKIDGTNSAVWISDDGTKIGAQSRTRWITPGNDNFGFARWVDENRENLSQLGPGRHFGEWYGAGIQRGYGLKEKRFALFNTHRWNADNVPEGCGVVPILYQGNYKDLDVEYLLTLLREGGSFAVPGFMRPEGLVLFHTADGNMKKVLLDGDELPKGITTFKERQVAEALSK